MIKIKIIKKLLLLIIIVILLAVLAVGAYLTYVESNSNKARDYLLEKYEINGKDWFAIKYTEFVYEDIADCNSLWLKKCTDKEDLLYQYTFINKERKQIIVSEDKNGNFSDDYNGTLKVKEEEEENTIIEESIPESN